MALHYNDKSVLENFHASSTFTLLREIGMLKAMPIEDRSQFRRVVTDVILATDMAFHLDWVNKFRVRVGQLDKSKTEDRILLMCIAIKCADISNVCKPKEVYLRWTDALIKEVSVHSFLNLHL